MPDDYEVLNKETDTTKDSLTNLGYPDSSGYMQNFCLCGACAPPNKHTTMDGKPIPIHVDEGGDEFCIVQGARYYMQPAVSATRPKGTR